MRTSHRRIARLIAEEADKITDRELFGSEAYRAYLTDIGESMAQRFGRPFTVKIQWDESPESGIAHTDGATVTINTANPISMSFPTRRLKADSILGFLAHESGHLLYTNFRVMKTYNQALSAGRFYPAKVPCKTPEEKQALAERQELAQKKDEAALAVIHQVAHDLFNIAEDAYIEARMCQDYPGKMKAGILLNNVRAMETSPSILKQIESGLPGYAIVRNLLLQYSTQGDVNNLGGYTGEYLDVLRDCIPIIDDCQYDEDARVRCKGVNRLILKLWPYLLPLIEKARKEGTEKTMAGLSEGFQPASEAPKGSTKPVAVPIAGGSATGGDPSTDVSGFIKPDPAAKKEDMEEIQKAVDHERSRIALIRTDSIDEGSGGGVFHNRFYGGSGYENGASDIERLLSTMAEKRVQSHLEQELSLELQDAANQIRYGNAHKGIQVTVNHMATIPDNLRRQYAQVAPPLLLLSRRMQRQLKDVIQVQRRGDKLCGLLMGRRFEARNLVRNDGRYFSKRSLPVDSCDMAVALLVDESGSMADGDRITSARATSIVLHDFCQSLDIPVMIMGHSAEWDGTGVSLYSYASFNSQDGNDRYRLMDISSRCNNRDGAALRFVAEQLVRRQEHVKLLILISDGQPLAVGYSGTEAEADLRGIRKEYARKGITMIAAAIGEDKPNIERIYKEGFLDITDLNKLPVMMTKLLTRYITH